MKRLNFYITWSLVWLLALSCEDQWDKRTGLQTGGAEVSDLSILDYIKAQTEYSEFLELLVSSGMDTLLQKGMQYTVWMPTAESMEGVSKLNDSLIYSFVMNHINVTGIYASAFEPEYSVKLVSGKRVKLRTDKEAVAGYRIADAGIVKSNILCKDGVIHELNSCLQPALNLYEKLEQQPEYGELLKILKRYNRRVFKPELSRQIGVDDWGNLIYDSVFVSENQILLKGDIREEDREFTVFATPDQVLQPCLEKLYRDFQDVNGRAPKHADSLELESWVVKSLVHNDVIKSYGSRENLYSVHNELWKCSKQEVSREYAECSNGLFYEVRKLHFPALLLMKALRNDLNDLVTKQAANGSNSTVDSILKNEITNKGASGSGFAPIAQRPSGVYCTQFRGIAGKKDGKDIVDFDFFIYWESFRVCQRIATGKLDSLASVSVMPGEYLVKGSYSKASQYCQEDIIVYVNGKKIGEITGIKELPNATFHNFTLGTVTIDESAGTAPVEFRFQGVTVTATRTQRLIAPFHIELIPTENNY